MRLQIVDEAANFSCGNCTACCDQPWRTLIEPDKAEALDHHDFAGRYPQLAGRTLYRRPADGGGRYFELVKGEGTRCIFLDTDGLCIIHKELGPEAKPHMCRQFPYLGSRAWRDDRVSVNYGCPSVQAQRGPGLPEQKAEIAALVALTDGSVRPDAPVMFDAQGKVTQAAYETFIDRAMEVFDECRDEDIWGRFQSLLHLLHCMKEVLASDGEAELDAVLSRGAANGSDGVTAFAPVQSAPMPVRLLFAATLQPDTLPPDAAGGLGFFRRLMLAPRLLSLATLKGRYASRLLGRTVSLDEVFAHPVEPRLDANSTRLLVRYIRARLWQRLIVGTRLPIVAGVHQHLLDIAAVLFFARAEAAAQGAARLSETHVRQALTRVEFHLANQKRLYDQTLRKWLRVQLCDLNVARETLRLATLGPSRQHGGDDAADPTEDSAHERPNAAGVRGKTRELQVAGK